MGRLLDDGLEVLDFGTCGWADILGMDFTNLGLE